MFLQFWKAKLIVFIFWINRCEYQSINNFTTRWCDVLIDFIRLFESSRIFVVHKVFHWLKLITGDFFFPLATFLRIIFAFMESLLTGIAFIRSELFFIYVLSGLVKLHVLVFVVVAQKKKIRPDIWWKSESQNLNLHDIFSRKNNGRTFEGTWRAIELNFIFQPLFSPSCGMARCTCVFTGHTYFALTWFVLVCPFSFFQFRIFRHDLSLSL